MLGTWAACGTSATNLCHVLSCCFVFPGESSRAGAIGSRRNSCSSLSHCSGEIICNYRDSLQSGLTWVLQIQNRDWVHQSITFRCIIKSIRFALFRATKFNESYIIRDLTSTKLSTHKNDYNKMRHYCITGREVKNKKRFYHAWKLSFYFSILWSNLVVLCAKVDSAEHWVLCLILHAFASLHVYPLVLFVYYL